MFEKIRNLFRRNRLEDTLEVRELSLGDSGSNGFFIVHPDGEAYAGPYKRRADALGQLTRIRKSYTPGARRPRV